MLEKTTTNLDTVALIGGGIVNLITAYYLVRAGFSVAIFDRAPAPQSKPDWRLLGCTTGGGDSRIFSLNESRHHLANSPHYTANISSPFRRIISDDGWLAISPSELSETDLRWIECFESIPQSLALLFNQDIISFNQESEPLWQEMIAQNSGLFNRAGYQGGLLRLYATQEKYAGALERERSIGAVKRELADVDIAIEIPSLYDAVKAGKIAGALGVSGFGVNIHALVDGLSRYLSDLGVRFYWNTQVNSIARDSRGRITGFLVDSEKVEATHYVLSIGAYSQHLLRGFESENAIAPILGLWLTLPDLSPELSRPLKITRSGFAANGAAEGANVVAGTDSEGRPVLHISAGHGYIGIGNEAKRYLDPFQLGRSVDETARDFFPKQFAAGQAEFGAMTESKRFCVRPWTASGLGIFERAETNRNGSFMITGGHNTGGFAQAPAVASAVLASIQSRSHPMHALYHPLRLSEARQSSSAKKSGNTRRAGAGGNYV